MTTSPPQEVSTDAPFSHRLQFLGEDLIDLVRQFVTSRYPPPTPSTDIIMLSSTPMQLGTIKRRYVSVHSGVNMVRILIAHKAKVQGGRVPRWYRIGILSHPIVFAVSPCPIEISREEGQLDPSQAVYTQPMDNNTVILELVSLMAQMVGNVISMFEELCAIFRDRTPSSVPRKGRVNLGLNVLVNLLTHWEEEETVKRPKRPESAEVIQVDEKPKAFHESEFLEILTGINRMRCE